MFAGLVTPVLGPLVVLPLSLLVVVGTEVLAIPPDENNMMLKISAN